MAKYDNAQDHTTLGAAEIEHRFGFHKATVEGKNATLPAHTGLRVQFRDFAEYLDRLIPGGRAKSVVFTELENASMWAHKAIAEQAPLIDEPPAPHEDEYGEPPTLPSKFEHPQTDNLVGRD